MRGSSRWRRPARGAAIVVLMAAVAVGCAVGPASNRAARMGPPAPTGEPPGTPPDDDGPGGFPTPSGDPTSPPPSTEPVPPASAEGSADVTVTLADGIEGLTSPCCMAEVPDSDDVLVGDQDTGMIYRVSEGGDVTTVGAPRSVTVSADRSLLSLAVDPASSGAVTVYAYYSHSSDNRIGAYTYDETESEGDQLTPSYESLVDDLPQSDDGGALAFGPDGMLYAATGTEILRMMSDGDAPDDNPEPGSPVYASGFTDVQGLAWDGAGQLWAVDGGDGSLSTITRDPQDGTVAPPMGVHSFDEDAAIEPTGLAYAADTRSLWLTTADDAGLYRIPLDGEGGLVADPALLPDAELGESLDVMPAGGDGLWVLTGGGAIRELAVS